MSASQTSPDDLVLVHRRNLSVCDAKSPVSSSPVANMDLDPTDDDASSVKMALSKQMDTTTTNNNNNNNKQLSLDDLVPAIANILGDPNYNLKGKNDPRIFKLMESFDASCMDWKRYEFWDDQKNYTRNLIATDNHSFTLMLLCWNRKKASPIHAHADSNCWMRIVSGACRETRYAWPQDANSPMVQIGQTVLQAPSVAYICDELGLHKVENALEDVGSVSLHLYSPPFDSCKVFLDPTCGKASECFGTFYSEHGHKVDYH